MKKDISILSFIWVVGGLLSLYGQESTIYQEPGEEILELVDVPPPPRVWIDSREENLILLYRNPFRSIRELAQKELRLAGIRVDPSTSIGSRVTYYRNIRIKRAGSTEAEPEQVAGLPGNPQLANFTWSPDQRYIAFTNTTAEGVEVWYLDVEERKVVRLSGPSANACLGDVINWFPDSRSLLVKMVPPSRKPLIDREEVVPEGPTVSVADGREAQNRTYQDLLSDRTDEHNFEQLVRSEIRKITLEGGSTPWMEAAMYSEIHISPDGNYVLVSTIRKPFSYLIPYYRFPSRSSVYTKEAELVETIVEVPLIEDLPKGFMAVREGRRDLSWRSDRPATLVFTRALDGGDPGKEVQYRDALLQLEPPFQGEPQLLMKTVNRFSEVVWGTEEQAVVYDYWWNNRNTKTYLIDPSEPSGKPVMLEDRNYQDRYSDPGRFVTRRNRWGKEVLSLEGSDAFLIGSGYSEEGQFPFLDRIDLESGEKTRIYRSEYTDRLENIGRFNVEKNRMLVRIESPADFPNYFFRDLRRNRLEQLTFFENPFQSIQDVHKELIQYKRDDGLELSGTLYLPAGYDKESGKKMPMILWAYPREFKDRASAGQTTANPNRFTYPNYGSPVYWVTRGYVILDGAAFPIVGEGANEPNDSFREQLVANARAAIDAVDSLGFIDRKRVAVGGHSYGAFMVANLLSHSDLFAAGIARSGAYNRTLTPFGFQSEERTYWEAPEVYYRMSPFMHADRMKTPLLLIHGEADNNSGTYPLQSKRYFNALKGLGATARLVMLPLESHGYRARESILHMLWEQDRWLEMYLK